MEDYRNGNLNRTNHNTTRLTSPRRKPGEVSLVASDPLMLIALSSKSLCNTLALQLAEAGFKVAFCGTSPAEDTLFAQRNGLIHCPVSEITPAAIVRMAAIIESRNHRAPLLLTDLSAANTLYIYKKRAGEGPTMEDRLPTDAEKPLREAGKESVGTFQDPVDSGVLTVDERDLANFFDVKSRSIIEYDCEDAPTQSLITAIVSSVVAIACSAGVQILTKLKIRSH